MAMDHDVRVLRRSLEAVPPELVVLPDPPPSWLGRARFVLDVLGLLAALVSGALLHAVLAGGMGARFDLLATGSKASFIAVWMTVMVLSLNHAGLYRSRVTRSVPDQIAGIARGMTYGSVVVLALAATPGLVVPKPAVVLAWGAGMVSLTLTRAAADSLERRLLRRTRSGVRAVIVGSGALAARVVAEQERHPEDGLRIIGSVGVDGVDPALGIPHLGTTPELARIVESFGVGQVLVAHEGAADESIIGAIWSCSGTDARVSVVASHPDFVLPFGEMDRLGSIPLIHVRTPDRRPVARAVRSVVDRLAASILLILSMPVLVVIGVLIKRDSQGPVLFRQTRVGKDGREFQMVKLRTMVHDADELKDHLRPQNQGAGPLFKMRDDPRVTRVGRWLRRTSLDELPQLWNVVKGQMSLVGPRPPTPDEVSMYPRWFRRRLAVRPGITGLWQVSGRSDLPFPEAMRMDLTYVESWSPWLDIQILMRTVTAVVRKKGAY